MREYTPVIDEEKPGPLAAWSVHAATTTFVALAAFTVWTHVCQAGQLSFRAYALIGVPLSALLSLLYFFAYRPGRHPRGESPLTPDPSPPSTGARGEDDAARTETRGEDGAATAWARGEEDAATAWTRVEKSQRIALLLLCLAASAFTLASYRFSGDDGYYVGNVNHYLAHPDDRLGFAVHTVHAEGEPFRSLHWATSMPLHYAEGAFSMVVGVPFLDVYYCLAPAWLACVLVLSWYYLLSCFRLSGRALLFGLLVLIVLVPLMGETKRTFGNMSFSLLYQGKVVLLAVGIPLFTGLLLSFARKASWLGWLRLLIVSTALAGCSASACVLLPLLMAAVSLPAVCLYARDKRDALGRLVLLGLSVFYLLGYTAVVYVDSRQQLGTSSLVNEGWPTTFAATLPFLFHPGVPVTGVLALASLAVTAWLLQGRERAFIVGWTLFVLVAYLNPIVAAVIIKSVTSPNAYWRVFYLAPFPLALGLAAGLLIDRFALTRWRTLAPAVLLVVAGAVGLHIVHWPSSIYQNDTGWLLAWHKVNLPARREAGEVLRAAPPGPMFAPKEIAEVVPILSGKHPQLCVRDRAVRLWLRQRDEEAVALERLAARKCLEGKPDADPRTLASLLRRQSLDLCSVIVARSALPEVDRLLRECGFQPTGASTRYLVYTQTKSDGR